ncbi:hypothetical protein [Ectobacillus ponti]|uniref:Uncharacterized protein n=1 Tax=Ectobacillus ponti TaxID=2961894 RepID=A0AA41X4X1_9BACI|nr:hypothetical protein [Ectobacillus ponti]MCP8968999.1 hypothetical protein [Ectobacillus ponti]
MRYIRKPKSLLAPPAPSKRSLHKGYGLKRRLQERKKEAIRKAKLNSYLNQRTAASFDIFELVKDISVSPVGANGALLLNRNNPKDREWMED